MEIVDCCNYACTARTDHETHDINVLAVLVLPFSLSENVIPNLDTLIAGSKESRMMQACRHADPETACWTHSISVASAPVLKRWSPCRVGDTFGQAVGMILWHRRYADY